MRPSATSVCGLKRLVLQEAKRRPAADSTPSKASGELAAKEARLAAARKALEDARALSSSLSTGKDSAAQVIYVCVYPKP